MNIYFLLNHTIFLSFVNELKRSQTKDENEMQNVGTFSLYSTASKHKKFLFETDSSESFISSSYPKI